MKVAICYPARNMVDTGFAFDAMNLIGHTITNHREIKIGIYTSLGTLIIDQRCNLAKEAMKEGADWILWIDTDMRFPKDGLQRLLAHNRPIVAANYVTRSIPVEPISFNFTGKAWERQHTFEHSTGLQQVTGTGMGFMLTSTQIFREIEEPYFHIAYSTVNKTFHGEDMFFCQKAAEKGFPTMIDHDLSKEIKHIGSFEFMHDHVMVANTAQTQMEQVSGMIEMPVPEAMAAD